MKNRWIFTGLALVMAGWLGSCTSTTHLASTQMTDDLYTSHNRRAIAEAEVRQAERQRQAEEQRALRNIEAAGQDYGYQSILSDSYEDSYERRLRGFQSLTYKMPSSYYDFYYSDKAWEASAYDPAFYNVIVMGDEVWVEPRYITSMFGNWGTTVNVNLGWGWNRWYRPYWDWYYSPSWGFHASSWGWGFGWNNYWGWGYDPWYWHYPSWGYSHHHHNYWGSGYWGGGQSGNYRNNYTSSSNRRGSMGNMASSTPGRYNNNAGNTTGSYRRSPSTSRENAGYNSGADNSGYRRSPSTSRENAGYNSGTDNSGYRRGSNSNSRSNSEGVNNSDSRRGNESNSSNSNYRNSNSNPPSNSSYRSSGPTSSGSRSSGNSGSAGSRSSSSSSGNRSSGGGRR